MALGACTRASDEGTQTRPRSLPAVQATLIHARDLRQSDARRGTDQPGRPPRQLAGAGHGVPERLRRAGADPGAGRASPARRGAICSNILGAGQPAHHICRMRAGTRISRPIRSRPHRRGPQSDAGGRARARHHPGVSALRRDVVCRLNARNPQFFDLYEINYRTGESPAGSRRIPAMAAGSSQPAQLARFGDTQQVPAAPPRCSAVRRRDLDGGFHDPRPRISDHQRDRLQPRR